MGSIIPSSVRKVIQYGDRYIQRHVISVYDKNELLKNWWEGNKFFIRKTFYQGRTDIVSGKVEKAGMAILNRFFGNKSPRELNKYLPHFSEIKEQLTQVIGKGKIGKARDVEMLIDILEFISRNTEKNIVVYSASRIKEGEIKKHYKELQTIRSIGPKIASFYLRDLTCLYELEKFLTEDDLILLQPIDTWVKKVTYRLGIVEDKELSDWEMRKRIVKACQNLDISTIKFNQGAWYIGYYAFDLVLDNLDKI